MHTLERWRGTRQLTYSFLPSDQNWRENAGAAEPEPWESPA